MSDSKPYGIPPNVDPTVLPNYDWVDGFTAKTTDVILPDFTRPCKPRAEIVHRAPRRWYVRGARDEWVDSGEPYWRDLGECITEWGAQRRAKRWIHSATRAQQWEEERREIEL